MTNKTTGSSALQQQGIGAIFAKLCNCRNMDRQSKPMSCNSAIVDAPVRHPDLAIYSQTEAVENSQVPSWDSPDIVTNNWRPFRLIPEANIKVRNISPSVAAVNALVHFYTSPFGIGTKKELKLTRVINVGAGQEVDLRFPFDQATLNGDQRIGVHILLEHPHDDHVVNNFGSQVHTGSYTTESGRSFAIHIPVLNDSFANRQMNLQIMPTDLIVAISPSNHLFGPQEQITATLNITVPGFLTGSAGNEINREVTVVGKLNTGELVGGVTTLLRIDN